MKVKIGPLKFTPDEWQALQRIPGRTDEQRVRAAIDFTLKAIVYREQAREQQVEAEAQANAAELAAQMEATNESP